MENDTDHIDDKDAQLLLYLADELNAAEQLQVQRRLESDASLRQQLEKLREVYASMDGRLSQADQLDPIMGAAAAHRCASAAVARWASIRQAKPVQQMHGWKIPVWAWSAAAAACLLIGLLAWQFWPHENVSTLAVAPRQPEELRPSTNQYEEMSSNTNLANAEQELDAVAYLRTLTE
ncbi:MAG TPA: hypothetical protein VHD56_07640 [Tepidisphaeraceae bacterium]|nr:hypothetical protein [Tepidisphaeraceae bacterium]